MRSGLLRCQTLFEARPIDNEALVRAVPHLVHAVLAVHVKSSWRPSTAASVTVAVTVSPSGVAAVWLMTICAPTVICSARGAADPLGGRLFHERREQGC